MRRRHELGRSFDDWARAVGSPDTGAMAAPALPQPQQEGRWILVATMRGIPSGYSATDLLDTRSGETRSGVAQPGAMLHHIELSL